MFGNKFEVGDLVWAKMNRFPYWPGKIISPLETKPGKKSGHYIYFYGSDNHAWIPEDKIMPHSEDMISSSKKKKSSHVFQNAIDAITKAALEGNTDEGLYGNTRKRRLSDQKDDSESDSSSSSHVPKVQRLDVSPSVSPAAADGLPRPLFPLSDDGDDSSIAGSSASSVSPTIPLLDTDRRIGSDSDEPVPPKCKKTIGFLGMGNMGQAIVKRLLEFGHQVFVWNRTSSVCDGLVEMGAFKCNYPKDVVEAADCTLCCVSDSEAVKDVVFGGFGVLQGLKASMLRRKGIRTSKGYVEMTSIDAETSQEVAEAVLVSGGRYLEAPIMGNREQAERGDVTVLGAGDKSLFNECEQFFVAFSKSAYYITNDVGESSKVNLILSSLTGTVYAALAEALALAKSSRVSQKELLDILKIFGFKTDLVTLKGQAMIEQKCGVNTALKHQQKDMNLTLTMSEEVDQPMPVTASANELYKYAKLLGYSNDDVAFVYHGVRNRSGNFNSL